MDRIIGRYTGQHHGALLIVFGAMHGNEPAGVEALKTVFKMLDNEPNVNPGFEFTGKMIGLIGNKKAFRQGKRFIKKDLNRYWEPDHLAKIKDQLITPDAEDLEMVQILEIIHQEIKNYNPTKLIVLDLHTTSSEGGIFAITTDDNDSLKIAIELHAPVIQGMLNGLKGTTLHYFVEKNTGLPTTAVTFESGQHNNPLSIDRAVAGIINCLRTIGCVDPIHIINRHDEILKEYAKDLPKVAMLTYRHPISQADHFRMEPNFITFQKVSKGQLLATDIKGEITSPDDGNILMPLYQKQGEDGFFIVKEITRFR